MQLPAHVAAGITLEKRPLLDPEKDWERRDEWIQHNSTIWGTVSQNRTPNFIFICLDLDLNEKCASDTRFFVTLGYVHRKQKLDFF